MFITKINSQLQRYEIRYATMLQTNRKMLGYMIKKSGCAALLRVLRIRLVYLLLTELVSELSLDELAVEASDIAEIGYAITSVFNAQ